MEDIMKIVKSLEEWGFLRFFPAFIRYINASLLESASTGQGILIRAGEGTIRAAQHV